MPLVLQSMLCAALVGAAVLGTSASCGPTPAPAPAWPAGTAMVLSGTPISVDEIDTAADVFARIEPLASLEHVRRLALNNVVFPRAGGAAIDSVARERARERARTCHAALVAGGEPALEAGESRNVSKGGFLDVGLEAWGLGVDAPSGVWFGPYETIGAFELGRVLSRANESHSNRVELEIELVTFPYLDPYDRHARIEAQLDRSKLEIVDPAWRDIVPIAWQHRLRGGSP